MIYHIIGTDGVDCQSVKFQIPRSIGVFLSFFVEIKPIVNAWRFLFGLRERIKRPVNRPQDLPVCGQIVEPLLRFFYFLQRGEAKTNHRGALLSCEAMLSYRFRSLYFSWNSSSSLAGAPLEKGIPEYAIIFWASSWFAQKLTIPSWAHVANQQRPFR